MKYAGEADDHVPGLPNGHCDWKDVCTLLDELQRMTTQQGIPVDLGGLDSYVNYYRYGSDYGVSETFERADARLQKHGFEIVQFPTGCDYYDFQIVPSSMVFLGNIEYEMDHMNPDEFCDDEIDQV